MPSSPTRFSGRGSANFERVRIAIGRFREQYGYWPTGLALGSHTHEAIKQHLTPLGYAMLANKLRLKTQIKHYLVLPYDENSNQFDYATDEVATVRTLVATTEVDRWIWGVALHEL